MSWLNSTCTLSQGHPTSYQNGGQVFPLVCVLRASVQQNWWSWVQIPAGVYFFFHFFCTFSFSWFLLLRKKNAEWATILKYWKMNEKWIFKNWMVEGGIKHKTKRVLKATLPLSYDTFLLIRGTLGNYELLRFNLMETVLLPVGEM